MFLELGLPFILRFVNDWRAGKTTVKEAVEKVKNVKNGIQSEKEVEVPTSAEEAEGLFLEKVERELGLPEYNLFSKSPTRLHLVFTHIVIHRSN
jgi:anoctamin-10